MHLKAQLNGFAKEYENCVILEMLVLIAGSNPLYPDNAQLLIRIKREPEVAPRRGLFNIPPN
jgi:hypothetical protein